MRLSNFHDSVTGTVFSLSAHILLLIVLAGWLRHAVIDLPTPLAVVLWTEPAPSAPQETQAEAVPRRVEDEPEPVLERSSEPAAIEEPPAPAPEREESVPEPESPPAREPELDPALIATMEPPPELPRPALPSVGEVDVGETEVSVRPLSGIIDVEPGGPADEERERLLQERLSRASRLPVEPEPGRRAPVGPGAPESTATETRPTGSPEGEGVLAAERGVTGPLGQRRIVYSEIPTYPAWARRLGLEADVRFRIWVTPDGRVGRIEILAYSGSGELDQLAEEALRRWRFEPLPRGVPQHDEWGVVPMSFTLVPRRE